MAIKHAFTSTKPDGSDSSLVRPSNWNAAHVVDETGLDTIGSVPLLVGTQNASDVVLGQAGVAVSVPGSLEVAGAAVITADNIGSQAVASAGHATTADSATSASSATTATAVDKAGTVNIGTTDATAIVLGKAGVPVTHGVHWNDVQGPAMQGAGTAALTQENYRDTGVPMLWMRHDQDDLLAFTYQMPHSRKLGTAVRVHCHVIPATTPQTNQNVRFSYAYCWAHKDAELPAVSGWTTGTSDFAVPSTGAKTFKHCYHHLFETTPTGDSDASILVVRLSRLGTDNADTYTTDKSSLTAAANLAILSVDAHVQIEKPGSVVEI